MRNVAAEPLGSVAKVGRGALVQSFPDERAGEQQNAYQTEHRAEHRAVTRHRARGRQVKRLRRPFLRSAHHARVEEHADVRRTGNEKELSSAAC